MALRLVQGRLFRLPFSPFWKTEPKYAHDALHATRKGQDSLDFLFRAVNSTKIYDYVLKSTPLYWAFVVSGGIVGGYYWGKFWENVFERHNRGRLYKDNPYVEPVEDDDE